MTFTLAFLWRWTSYTEDPDGKKMVLAVLFIAGDGCLSE